MAAWSGLGINYGQQTQSGADPSSYLDNDLTLLWNAGVRRIRVAMSSYTYATGVDISKTIALAAKAKGFYTVWGVHASGRNDGNWAAYASAINDAADWAWNSGSPRIDEFMCGNENEASWNISGTLTTPVTKILAVASDVKTNHFLGNVSYAMAQDSLESTWRSGGIGSLDFLGYNVYGSSGSFSDFKSKILTNKATFGNKLYLSEWNLNSAWASFPADETQQTKDIADRLEWLKTVMTMPIYFHCYRWDQSNDQFSLWKSSENRFRYWYNVLLAKRMVL